MAGDGRDLGGVGEFLRFDLVAHRLDGSGIGADEDDARLRQRDREGRALGQKAVARMDRFGAGLLAGGDDFLDRQIGLGRRGRSDGDRLVGHLDVKRVLVGFGIDRDGLDPHAARRPDDAAGDLAPVGDEDFLEHRLPSRGQREACPWKPFLLERNERVNSVSAPRPVVKAGDRSGGSGRREGRGDRRRAPRIPRLNNSCRPARGAKRGRPTRG